MAIDDAAPAPLDAIVPRHVVLEGCVNFREVAGYEVAGGPAQYDPDYACG